MIRRRLNRLAAELAAGPCPVCDSPPGFRVLIDAGAEAPPPCPICGRPDVLEIEELIVSGPAAEETCP